jgi:LysM repeat protein
VSAPPGWSEIRVADGDTLSAIAARSGTTVERLQEVNCLEDDLIVSGSRLLAPGRFEQPVALAPTAAGAVPVGAGGNGGEDGVGAPVAPQAGQVNDISDEASILQSILTPNDDACAVPGDEPVPEQPELRAGVEFDRITTTFEIAQLVCIFALGFDRSANPILAIQPPSAGEPLFLGRRGDIFRWWLPLAPGTPHGSYTIVVEDENGNQAPAQITVRGATEERMLIVPAIYPPDIPVPLYLAHVPKGTYALAIFREGVGSDGQRYSRVPVSLPNIDVSGGTGRWGDVTYRIDTSQLQPGVEGAVYHVSLGDFDLRFAEPLWRTFTLLPAE